MIGLRAALTTLLLGFLLAGPAVANDKVYYYSGDTLQSEVVITDANRNVVERTYYAPYGQVLNRALRDGPGYTGHEEDPETSLVYMQQRYFDPESRRFLSNDPVATTDEGAGFNRYVYANDNPYRYTDPTGAEGVGRWNDGENLGTAEMENGMSREEAAEFVASFIPGLTDIVGAKNLAEHPSLLNAGILAASLVDLGGVAKMLGKAADAAEGAAWTAPSMLARVIPNGVEATTLGARGAADVFVTTPEAIEGLGAAGIAGRLGIAESPTGFQIIRFSTPEEGLASPVFRSNPGFVGRGLTSGGAPEFVIPNGPIPPGASITVVPP